MLMVVFSSDVNECVLGIDTCGPDHQCINEEGGYHCECAKGYRLNWDNRTCIGEFLRFCTIPHNHYLVTYYTQ